MMLQTQDYRVSDVTDYVNWLYFFHAWGFPSRYASIAKVHGCQACRLNWLQSFPAEERGRAQEAMHLYDDAVAALRTFSQLSFSTHFRFLLVEANGAGDDLVLYLPTGDRHLPLLRQQSVHRTGDQHLPGVALCLADFVRPKECGPDCVGLFVSTVDAAMERWGDGDEYKGMLAQTLADRLAEAAAERGHQEVRRKWWGYAMDEHLTVEELFAERYQGKRPAVGYPSLPDQSLNFLLSELLDFPSLGVSLTEHGAMLPHASTSGLMLSHPATCHFSVGQIGEDQLHDYALRRGIPVEQLRPFLCRS